MTSQEEPTSSYFQPRNITNMRFTKSLVPLALLGFVSAAPTDLLLVEESRSLVPTPASLQERSTTTCDQWGSITTGAYIVYNDLWGESYATSGSQCITVSGLTNGILSWSTSWTWAGGSSNVKSYANAALVFTPRTLATISSLTAVWKYTLVFEGYELCASSCFADTAIATPERRSMPTSPLTPFCPVAAALLRPLMKL